MSDKMGGGVSEAASVAQLSSHRRVAAVFGISILLVLLTRLPLMPTHLYSFDSVNLALALEDFDPGRNQPQPPGYTLFVAEARLLYWLLGTPERTFSALKILISGLSVGMLYLLGKLMFSRWVGLTAAALLFVNPVFWRSGLVSSLRLHLALISILVAYCCWRAYGGERRYFYWASLVLGLGSGFRPELLLVLLPLWGWVGWKSHQRGVLLRGALLLTVLTLTWITVLIIACGGITRTIHSFTDYFHAQVQQSSVLVDPSLSSWRLMAGRAIIWTGLGSLPWLWTLPFGWLRRNTLPHWTRYLSFSAIWFLPPFLFNLFVHIGSPGHALATIPILCLLGGFCLISAEQFFAQRWIPELEERGLLIWVALLANVFLFFGYFPLPQGPPSAQFRGFASIKDAFLGRLYETSHARVRWVDQMTDLGLKQIATLRSATKGPVSLIWARDGEPTWRKLSFYLPSEKVVVLEESGDPLVVLPRTRLWLGNRVLEEYTGRPPFRLSVPKGGRLIWILGPANVESLARAVRVQGVPPVYYTDLPPDAPPFRWGSFEFAPE